MLAPKRTDSRVGNRETYMLASEDIQDDKSDDDGKWKVEWNGQDNENILELQMGIR